jgi:chromosome segregation protein
VHFTRLRLQGFKSFVDPTELLIQPGLSGVVGPNGCGKSNLLEALRWVMGENRPSIMRGEGMEDVIFAGSAARPARGHAEVTLTIDNADRRAPAAFNDADLLEIVRRITRDAGSAYRVNGREARARDVQMLFADASTGSQSPSLVRQGQIAELINARPKARRRILEEAAGISGLYQRRHEAELKLRATEANLGRVADVLEALQNQLAALARQARQAGRYREIAEALRRTEAMLLYRLWRDADLERATTRAALTEALRRTAAAEAEAAAATRRRDEAAEALPALREEDAVAGAILQRALVERDRLDAEAAEAARRISELDAARAQLDRDAGREGSLDRDAAETLARLAEEAAALDAAREGHAEALSEAEALAAQARDALATAEADHDRLAEQVARLGARHQTVEAQAAEARRRAATADRALAEAEAARDRLAAERGGRRNRPRRRGRSRRANFRPGRRRGNRAGRGRDRPRRGSDRRIRRPRPAVGDRGRRKGARRRGGRPRTAARRRSRRRPRHARPDRRRPRLRTRLRRRAGRGHRRARSRRGRAGHRLAHPAAGAGSGRPARGRPPARRACGGARRARPPPRGDRARRPAAGDGLQAELLPGQRLVSAEGDLWRWDGLRVAAGDAPSAAALRLQNRNRLRSLAAGLAEAAGAAATARSDHAAAAEALARAQAAEAAARTARRTADQAAADAARALSRAETALEQLLARQEGLVAAARRRAEECAGARQALAEAEAEAAALDDLTAARAEVETSRLRLEAARLAMLTRRTAADELRRAGEARDRRTEDIARETATWQTRRATAAERLADLERRAEAAAAALAAARRLPAEIDDRRARLGATLAETEDRRRRAADALAAAETAQRAADQAARAADQAAGEAREARARAEALAEAAAARVAAAEERLLQEAEATPADLLDRIGTDPEAIPPAAELEAEAGSLRRQRDALGAVNLRADEDARETQAEHDTLAAERADLEEAVRKLRIGIASLNREGRGRLLAAFDEVNRNFATLFRHLFGGGEASLVLVESDDPLEAGLEIMCQPPGKKLSTLSLLSGGEQTLTALSLIFAVFLANPSPICVLDEVDAPLDDANVTRFCDLLDEMCQRTDTRFLIITHHAVTMARMDRLFGVTMVEQGVSQLVSVDLVRAERLVEAV